MKLIKPEARIYQQEPGLQGIYKAIADAAKICYQTEKSKLSDEEFVQMLIKKGHLRPLEFGTVYLTFEETDRIIYDFESTKPYTMSTAVNYGPDGYTVFITTNYRVLYEHGWTHLAQRTEKTCHHPERYTVDFICSRGCGDDFRTHVTMSSVMESTRYCNYSNDKFGNELSFIEPYWDYTNDDIEDFKEIERIYMKKLAKNYQPQQAKNFLGLGVKTQLRMCGFWYAWNNFFEKRCDTAAYPECQTLAKQAKELLKL